MHFSRLAATGGRYPGQRASALFSASIVASIVAQAHRRRLVESAGIGATSERQAARQPANALTHQLAAKAPGNHSGAFPKLTTASRLGYRQAPDDQVGLFCSSDCAR